MRTKLAVKLEIWRLEVDVRGTVEEGSALNIINLLAPESRDSGSIQHCLGGSYLRSSPYCPLFSLREEDFGWKGRGEKCKGVADALKVPHSSFWRFSMINRKAARAGAELRGGKTYPGESRVA